MSIAFGAFGLVLFVMMLCAVDLSVWMDVTGFLCPISVSVILVGIAAFAFKTSAPNSHSAANNITAFIIVDIFRTAQIFGGTQQHWAVNGVLLPNF